MTEQANNGAAQNNEGPQFSLQRIYVKDLSFEAPKSPEIFRQEWTPSVALDLNTKQKSLDGDFHEVVLTLSVTVKTGEEIAFIAEVQQAGIFLIKGLDPASMGHTLGAFCPNILFPYAREALDGLVIRGSFPALMLSPVNFDALYAQELQRQQQAAQADHARLHRGERQHRRVAAAGEPGGLAHGDGAQHGGSQHQRVAPAQLGRAARIATAQQCSPQQ